MKDTSLAEKLLLCQLSQSNCKEWWYFSSPIRLPEGFSTWNMLDNLNIGVIATFSVITCSNPNTFICICVFQMTSLWECFQVNVNVHIVHTIYAITENSW